MQHREVNMIVNDQIYVPCGQQCLQADCACAQHSRPMRRVPEHSHIAVRTQSANNRGGNYSDAAMAGAEARSYECNFGTRTH